MINKNDYLPIGSIGKAHGVSGECNARLIVDLSPLMEEGEEPLFLFFEIDGLLVPFRLLTYRDKGAEASLLRFKGVNTKEEAERYLGVQLFLHRDYLADSDEELSLDLLRGYTLSDQHGQPLGTVIDIDESTLNTLLLIRNFEGEELLIPFADELIVHLDKANRSLALNIPDGLL